MLLAEDGRHSWLGATEDVNGWRAKSTLVSKLTDRDEHDSVPGGPAARVAASLTNDILAAIGRN